MAVPEAEKYLPKELEASHAFDEVNRWHLGANTLDILASLPLTRIHRVASDYITTSVAYFANHTDDKLLEEVGTTAWHAINQGRALTAYCDDLRAGAIEFGMPPQYALALKPEEPSFLIVGKVRERVMDETAIALIPPHLIVRAQQKPVEALAAMAFILSQIRDFSNGRKYIDRELSIPRSIAIEAQFLLSALREQPDLQLAPIYRETLTRYPHGTDDLPARARYKGTTGIEARKANQN